jgi:hypothetical protein
MDSEEKEPTPKRLKFTPSQELILRSHTSKHQENNLIDIFNGTRIHIVEKGITSVQLGVLKKNISSKGP